MKVYELIEALRQMDPDLEVVGPTLARKRIVGLEAREVRLERERWSANDYPILNTKAVVLV